MPITWELVELKVFESIKYYMKLLGISKFQISQRYQKIPILFIQRTIVLFCFLFNFASSFSFLIIEKTNNVRDSAEAFASTISYILVLVWYIYSLLNSDKIEYFINKLQAIMENRN